MNVLQLAEALGADVLSGDGEALGREVAAGYIGDLLSWVMGRAPDDCAWITIMQNLNVAAVAVLANVSCVVLAEGVTPDEALLKKVRAQNVALMSVGMPAFDIAVRLGELLSSDGRK